jgi:hypothetical protein
MLSILSDVLSANFHVKLSQNGEGSGFVIFTILNFHYDSRAQIFDISHCQIGDFIASKAVTLSNKQDLTYNNNTSLQIIIFFIYLLSKPYFCV